MKGSRPLKIGVIGDGSFVEAWLSTLTGNGHIIHTLFCYNSQDTDMLSIRYNVKYPALSPLHIYSDLDVNLVLIATAPKLIERELIEVSKKEKLCLICSLYTSPSPTITSFFGKKQTYLSYPLRMVRAVQEMRKVVGEGVLGKLSLFEIRLEMPTTLGLNTTCFDWMCEGMMGGGVLNCFGSHCIDAIMFISNENIKEVCCRLCTFFKKTDTIKGFRTISSDDFCSLQLKTNSGTFATVECIGNVPGKERFLIKVIGEYASLSFDGVNLIKESREEGKIKILDVESQSEAGVFSRPFEEGILRQMDCLAGTLDKEIVSDQMIDVINHSHMNSISRVMQAATTSNKTCSWVMIEQAT
ncbi:Glucose-fructose oxidoreductase domain-containing protein 1-like [Oopsacas minuta]|uniref:Glucose-fructose oxidoreductase domain-containing protein 1-like n=1 Tax=Oopsacas minuta TaxID=111878 RepID=A0AAV7K224_9METZ|nr:Glucose-fructose oxidoreductase domain-containing protein 1-like [Oopsacas minuta]